MKKWFKPKRKILENCEHTNEAASADTDPPPGDGDLDPTVRIKSFTSILARGPSLSSVIMYLYTYVYIFMFYF
jgi:hypothetical protein